MSGRIRTVKPEWLEDEALLRAGSAARVLSVALILKADDYGNGRCVPEAMCSEVFPFEDDPYGEFTEGLRRLSAMRFVVLYRVGEQRYFSIRNWSKHQRVKNPSNPRVPGPESSDSVNMHDSPKHLRMVSVDPGETLTPDPIRSDHDPDHYPDQGRGADRGYPGLWDRFDRSRANEYLAELAEHWPGLNVMANRQPDAAQGLFAHFSALSADQRATAFAKLAKAYRADDFAPRSVAKFLAESDLTKFVAAKPKGGAVPPAPHSEHVLGEEKF